MTSGGAGAPAPAESMQWIGSVYSPDHPNDALAIIAWVNANGGEARYEQREATRADIRYRYEHVIAVRTRDGLAYCAPGQRVVMGEEFEIGEGSRGQLVYLREFTVED